MNSRIFTAISLLAMTACSTSVVDTAVKITNLESNSGGSGTIYSSDSSHSEVLTNAHVCGVVKNGGLVHTSSGGSYMVTSFKVSEIHDLCLLTVAADLGGHTRISLAPPTLLDTSTVAGHPRLLPLIVTSGHFSQKMIIQIMTGVKACTQEDLQNPDTILFCVFAGGLPIIKSFESLVVSNTIQPGSSGSAVYDSTGALAAVIFAGAGDFGYGLAVPQEYVYSFLAKELPALPIQSPKYTMDFSSNKSSSNRKVTALIGALCKDKPELKDNAVCKGFVNAAKYSDLIER